MHQSTHFILYSTVTGRLVLSFFSIFERPIHKAVCSLHLAFSLGEKNTREPRIESVLLSFLLQVLPNNTSRTITANNLTPALKQKKWFKLIYLCAKWMNSINESKFTFNLKINFNGSDVAWYLLMFTLLVAFHNPLTSLYIWIHCNLLQYSLFSTYNVMVPPSPERSVCESLWRWHPNLNEPFSPLYSLWTQSNAYPRPVCMDK